SRDQIRLFLKLVAADVRNFGYFDIQYRPFIRIQPATAVVGGKKVTTRAEMVFASGLVCSANILPNLQRTNGIRIASTAVAFVRVVYETLKKVFPRVRTNAPVKFRKQATDIDVVVLTD